MANKYAKQETEQEEGPLNIRFTWSSTLRHPAEDAPDMTPEQHAASLQAHIHKTLSETPDLNQNPMWRELAGSAREIREHGTTVSLPRETRPPVISVSSPNGNVAEIDLHKEVSDQTDSLLTNAQLRRSALTSQFERNGDPDGITSKSRAFERYYDQMSNHYLATGEGPQAPLNTRSNTSYKAFYEAFQNPTPEMNQHMEHLQVMRGTVQDITQRANLSIDDYNKNGPQVPIPQGSHELRVEKENGSHHIDLVEGSEHADARHTNIYDDGLSVSTTLVPASRGASRAQSSAQPADLGDLAVKAASQHADMGTTASRIAGGDENRAMNLVLLHDREMNKTFEGNQRTPVKTIDRENPGFEALWTSPEAIQYRATRRDIAEANNENIAPGHKFEQAHLDTKNAMDPQSQLPHINESEVSKALIDQSPITQAPRSMSSKSAVGRNDYLIQADGGEMSRDVIRDYIELARQHEKEKTPDFTRVMAQSEQIGAKTRETTGIDVEKMSKGPEAKNIRLFADADHYVGLEGQSYFNNGAEIKKVLDQTPANKTAISFTGADTQFGETLASTALSTGRHVYDGAIVTKKQQILVPSEKTTENIDRNVERAEGFIQTQITKERLVTLPAEKMQPINAEDATRRAKVGSDLAPIADFINNPNKGTSTEQTALDTSRRASMLDVQVNSQEGLSFLSRVMRPTEALRVTNEMDQKNDPHTFRQLMTQDNEYPGAKQAVTNAFNAPANSPEGEKFFNGYRAAISSPAARAANTEASSPRGNTIIATIIDASPKILGDSRELANTYVKDAGTKTIEEHVDAKIRSDIDVNHINHTEERITKAVSTAFDAPKMGTLAVGSPAGREYLGEIMEHHQGINLNSLSDNDRKMSINALSQTREGQTQSNLAEGSEARMRADTIFAISDAHRRTVNVLPKALKQADMEHPDLTRTRAIDPLSREAQEFTRGAVINMTVAPTMHMGQRPQPLISEANEQNPLNLGIRERGTPHLISVLASTHDPQPLMERAEKLTPPGTVPTMHALIDAGRADTANLLTPDVRPKYVATKIAEAHTTEQASIGTAYISKVAHGSPEGLSALLAVPATSPLGQNIIKNLAETPEKGDTVNRLLHAGNASPTLTIGDLSQAGKAHDFLQKAISGGDLTPSLPKNSPLAPHEDIVSTIASNLRPLQGITDKPNLSPSQSSYIKETQAKIRKDFTANTLSPISAFNSLPVNSPLGHKALEETGVTAAVSATTGTKLSNAQTAKILTEPTASTPAATTFADVRRQANMSAKQAIMDNRSQLPPDNAALLAFRAERPGVLHAAARAINARNDALTYSTHGGEGSAIVDHLAPVEKGQTPSSTIAQAHFSSIKDMQRVGIAILTGNPETPGVPSKMIGDIKKQIASGNQTATEKMSAPLALAVKVARGMNNPEMIGEANYAARTAAERAAPLPSENTYHQRLGLAATTSGTIYGFVGHSERDFTILNLADKREKTGGSAPILVDKHKGILTPEESDLHFADYKKAQLTSNAARLSTISAAPTNTPVAAMFAKELLPDDPKSQKLVLSNFPTLGKAMAVGYDHLNGSTRDNGYSPEVTFAAAKLTDRSLDPQTVKKVTDSVRGGPESKMGPVISIEMEQAKAIHPRLQPMVDPRLPLPPGNAMMDITTSGGTLYEHGIIAIVGDKQKLTHPERDQIGATVDALAKSANDKTGADAAAKPIAIATTLTNGTGIETIRAAVRNNIPVIAYGTQDPFAHPNIEELHTGSKEPTKDDLKRIANTSLTKLLTESTSRDLEPHELQTVGASLSVAGRGGMIYSTALPNEDHNMLLAAKAGTTTIIGKVADDSLAVSGLLKNAKENPTMALQDPNPTTHHDPASPETKSWGGTTALRTEYNPIAIIHNNRDRISLTENAEFAVQGGPLISPSLQDTGKGIHTITGSKDMDTAVAIARQPENDRILGRHSEAEKSLIITPDTTTRREIHQAMLDAALSGPSPEKAAHEHTPQTPAQTMENRRLESQEMTSINKKNVHTGSFTIMDFENPSIKEMAKAQEDELTMRSASANEKNGIRRLSSSALAKLDLAAPKVVSSVDAADRHTTITDREKALEQAEKAMSQGASQNTPTRRKAQAVNAGQERD